MNIGLLAHEAVESGGPVVETADTTRSNTPMWIVFITFGIVALMALALKLLAKPPANNTEKERK